MREIRRSEFIEVEAVLGGKLREKTVTASAVERLRRFYEEERTNTKFIDSRMEATSMKKTFVWNRPKFRADAILSCEVAGTAIPLCVVVESKSHRSKASARAGDAWLVMMAPASPAAVVGYLAHFTERWLHGWWVLAAAVASLVTFFLVADLISRSPRALKMSAIAQLKKYPAHERWLALPATLLDSLGPETTIALCGMRALAWSP